MSREISKYRCKDCGTEYYPIPPIFQCPKCKSRRSERIEFVEKILVETHEEREEEKEENVWTKVCQFQLKPKNKEQIHGRCALTGMGTTPASLGLINVERIFYGPCNLEMCPMYQTWNLLKEKQ